MYRNSVLCSQPSGTPAAAQLRGRASTELGQVDAIVAAPRGKQVRQRIYPLKWWQVPLLLLISAGADGACWLPQAADQLLTVQPLPR